MASAEGAAAAARGAAEKAESDLAALSGAYNSLEDHAYALEEKLKQAEAATEAPLAAGAAAAASGSGSSEAEVQQRIDAAVAAALAAVGASAAPAPRPGGPGDWLFAADAERRAAAAAAEARAAAEAEAEAEATDLLVCLGQEEERVARLTARLLELGEDVDSLLQGIGDEENEASGGQQGDAAEGGDELL